MRMDIMRDLSGNVWERKGDPPEDLSQLEQDGYSQYNIHPRRQRGQEEITYMMQTVEDGTPLNAKLCGVVGQSDPLKQINNCFLKVDAGLIKGIALDSEWVAYKA